MTGESNLFEPESVWEFSVSDRVKFGPNAVTEIDGDLRRAGAEEILLFTDRGVKEAGVIDEVTASLDGFDYHVYDRVEPDPDADTFEDAVKVTREIDPDLLVGVGGGSVIDVTKTTSILAEHGGDLLEYVAPPTGEGRQIPGDGIPTIAVPTTAGTGSETSPVSVISLPDRDMKVGISSPHQHPDLALVDPLLTVSLPPKPTAASGMDALCHAVEAFTTRRYDANERPDRPEERPDYGGRTPLTDLFARKAITLIGGSLRQAVNTGTDVQARCDMALGSLLAGVAFTNAGLGATHAMAMTIGAEYDTPHGETIAALLPEVMRYNAPAASDRYREIADLLGESTSDGSTEAESRLAADAVERLATDVGMTHDLSAFGVDGDVSDLASKTMQLQRLLAGNPRRVEQSDIEAMYRSLQ